MALGDNVTGYWSLNGHTNDAVGSNDGVVSGATLATGKVNQCYNSTYYDPLKILFTCH